MKNMRRDPEDGPLKGDYPATREDVKNVWQYSELEKEYELQCDGLLLHEHPGFAFISLNEMVLEAWVT